MNNTVLNHKLSTCRTSCVSCVKGKKFLINISGSWMCPKCVKLYIQHDIVAHCKNCCKLTVHRRHKKHELDDQKTSTKIVEQIKNYFT